MSKDKNPAAPESFQTFGDLLVHLRKRARLTQEELGRAVGYSRTQITLLEKNQRSPAVEAVRALFLPALDLEAAPGLAQRLIDLAARTRKPRTNLPASVNALIGRERDTAGVCAWLRSPVRRLVTLVGPPGIGKTSLSLQAAADLLSDFAGGVFFVPLAPIEEPALVAPAILQALGSARSERRTPLEQLVEHLGARQVLILLDNFEHLLDAAGLVSELLARCPGLKLMVTSRESLRIPGEWLYPLPPLTLPDERQAKELGLADIDQFSALRLFSERARAVRFDFALTRENIPAVSAICRRLDGLPLAIELIAPRIRQMPPQALLSRLTRDFSLHAGGLRNASERQSTLYNAIAWSYDLLPANEQSLLRRLAVFAGGWTLEAAEAVCAGGEVAADQVESLLLRLMDKSLLHADNSLDQPRFGVLETIHEFAHDRLEKSGEIEQVKNSHLNFFVEFAQTSNQNLFGAPQAALVVRLDAEYPNLRLALARAEDSRQTEGFMRLAVALGYYWYLRQNIKEGTLWLGRALQAHNASALEAPNLRANILLWLSEIERLQASFSNAWAHAQESRRLFQDLGDQTGLANALRALSGIALGERHYHEARLLLEESLGLQEASGSPHSLAWVFNGLGEAARAEDDYAAAEGYYLKALDLYRNAGDEFRICNSIQNLGFVALLQNNYSLARERLQESLGTARKLNDMAIIQGSLVGLAGLAGSGGEPAGAVKVLAAVNKAISTEGGPLDSTDQSLHDRILAQLRRQLGEELFASAWAQGWQLSIDQAIELTLREIK